VGTSWAALEDEEVGGIKAQLNSLKIGTTALRAELLNIKIFHSMLDL
jgi:hypothetical protein